MKFLASIITLLVMATATMPSFAADKEAAACLPPDTLLYVQVTSVAQLREHARKHGLWALCQDPAMKRVVDQMSEAVNKKIDKKFKDMCEELNVEEPPSDLPLPMGA